MLDGEEKQFGFIGKTVRRVDEQGFIYEYIILTKWYQKLAHNLLVVGIILGTIFFVIAKIASPGGKINWGYKCIRTPSPSVDIDYRPF